MSNMHILDVDPSTGVARIVMHFPTPSGNNAVSVAWVTALINSGLNKTIMTTGAGAGQITAVEASAVVAGTVYECVHSVIPDPFSNAARLAQLDVLYPLMQTQILAELQKRLQFFGFTR